MVIIDSGIANTKYVESVKEFQFYTTDVDDCQYKITMKSENLTYDYCSDYSTEYKELYAAKEIDAILTGTKKYGDNKADYVEFVKRKVVKQGDKI